MSYSEVAEHPAPVPASARLDTNNPTVKPLEQRGETMLGKFAVRTPFYVLTLGLAIIFLYPLLWTAISSFSPQPGTSQAVGWGFGNYENLAHLQFGLWHYISNTLLITITTVITTLLVSTLAGYAFAKFSFPGKNALFLIVLAILMIPGATLLLPMVVWLHNLGLSNSRIGAGLVLSVFQLPFATFMMRISFESVPKELEEAALIDGCNSFGALWRVMLHAVKPGMITVGLFAFLAAWNDIMVPLYLLGGRNQPLALALVNMRAMAGGFGGINFGAVQAGVVVLTVPCVILFFALQRYYVSGFMSGALKG